MKIREYEILEKIGQPGGMAVVYKAKHQSLEVVRAIKKLHFHLSGSTTIIQRFENEARALSILEHPNIVKVYDFFREGDSHYLIMEYVDGPSLAEILKKSALSEKVALDYLKQILSTMSFAHSKKILHRDIKPSNILINSQGVIKVVDFGIAKMMDRKGVTSTGLTIGSPWYMSPEQIIGHDLDERSDIYSLGITLFEMLTAHVPFNDTSEYKIYEMHQKEPIPSLHKFDPNFSPELEAIIKKASAKDPKERYQSADAFAEAVDIYLALSDLGGAGATIASFDPSEYMDIKKTKAKTKAKTEAISKTTMKNLEEIAAEQPAETEEKPTPEKTEKRTKYQQATVFQDISETKAKPDDTSELIEHKAIPGIEQPRSVVKKVLPFLLGFLVLVIIAVVYLFLPESAPESLIIKQSEVSYNSLELGWPEVEKADHYSISRKPYASAQFQFLNTVLSTSFTDSTVDPGKEYIYQVTANNKDEKILAVGEFSGLTPELNFGLMVDNVTGSKITLTWNQLEQVDSYILYRQNSDADSPDDLKEVYRGSKTSFTDKKVKANKSYDYVVKVIFNNQTEYESESITVLNEKVAAFGNLYVNSTPSGAKVFLGGEEVGTTPYIRKGLGVGRYNIAIKKEGYMNFSERARVRANRRTTINADLVAAIGTLGILVRPYGSILIDGELVKKDTPVQYTTELPAGKHKVTIVHSGLNVRWEKSINISGAKKENLVIDFTKMVTVTVISKPWGTIFVDGKSTGETTPKQIKLRVGQHTIGIQREGYKAVGGSKTINFEENLKEPLEFVLEKK